MSGVPRSIFGLNFTQQMIFFSRVINTMWTLQFISIHLGLFENGVSQQFLMFCRENQICPARPLPASNASAVCHCSAKPQALMAAEKPQNETAHNRACKRRHGRHHETNHRHFTGIVRHNLINLKLQYLVESIRVPSLIIYENYLVSISRRKELMDDEDDHVLISSFALSLQLPELQFDANLRYLSSQSEIEVISQLTVVIFFTTC